MYVYRAWLTWRLNSAAENGSDVGTVQKRSPNPSEDHVSPVDKLRAGRGEREREGEGEGEERGRERERERSLCRTQPLLATYLRS